MIMHRNNKFPSKNNLERRSAHASRGSRVTSSFIHGAESSKHSNFRHSPSLPYRTNQFPTKLLLIMLAIIACIIMITVALQNCSHAREYNWENLQYENGRIFYSENGTITSLTGIDVSSHQGTIDWNAVSQDGIDFAMIRCGTRGYTEGSLFADETFYTNADGAQTAGIPFGVYFFSQAINEQEAIEEAEYVLELIQGMEISCPIAFDLEDMPSYNARANDLSAEQITANAEAFCNRIKQAGYEVMIYGNQHDLSRYDLEHLNEEIWYAEYNGTQPTTSIPLVMWQYTSTGSVSGISTNVDLNILFDANLVHAN